jgi:hypothetical protein
MRKAIATPARRVAPVDHLGPGRGDVDPRKLHDCDGATRPRGRDGDNPGLAHPPQVLEERSPRIGSSTTFSGARRRRWFAGGGS